MKMSLGSLDFRFGFIFNYFLWEFLNNGTFITIFIKQFKMFVQRGSIKLSLKKGFLLTSDWVIIIVIMEVI